MVYEQGGDCGRGCFRRIDEQGEVMNMKRMILSLAASMFSSLAIGTGVASSDCRPNAATMKRLSDDVREGELCQMTCRAHLSLAIGAAEGLGARLF